MTSQVKEIGMESRLTARCKQIRKSWSDSEKAMREMRANLAQSRLALAILFRDINGGCTK
jgi:hypothetical protein